MCSTPAPPLTARVASSIWSGTGEVNTSPGQAASSMPYPTNPPCSGSGPEAPADTRPPLAPPRPAGPRDALVPAVAPQRRVRGGDPRQRVRDHRVDRVDQLLHDVAP